MTLNQYLSDAKINDQDFATLIGVERSTVTRLRGGNQIPKPDVMRAIAETTSGKVTANDFFGIAA